MPLPEINEARLQGLVDALRAFRQEWGCDQLSASYVTPDGELLALDVGHEYAFVRTEDGDNAVVWSKWDEREP